MFLKGAPLLPSLRLLPPFDDTQNTSPETAVALDDVELELELELLELVEDELFELELLDDELDDEFDEEFDDDDSDEPVNCFAALLRNLPNCADENCGAVSAIANARTAIRVIFFILVEINYVLVKQFNIKTITPV